MFTRRRFIAHTALAAAVGSLAATLPGVTPSAESPPPPEPRLLDRARSLLKQGPLIDTHNDLPSMFLETHAEDFTTLDMGKVQPTLCADIPRLREGCVGAQYWSIFVEGNTQATHASLHDAIREFDVAFRFIRARPELELATTANDVERIHRAGHIASLLGVEGGHMIENSAAALRIFQELGARYLTLTHFDNIAWADSATDRVQNHGLTEFGRRIVRELNRIGMFADISHVSADTMRDTLRTTRAPVIFSHSNAFAIDPHVRKVPDDVLLMLAANGGVVHVNFLKEFVSPRDPAWQAKRAEAVRQFHSRLDTDNAVQSAMTEWENRNPHPRGTIADVADHIDHIRKIAGVDCIGVGADFFDAGRRSMAIGLDDVTRYPYLFAELLRRGYSDEDVLKIAGRNHRRAMRKMAAVSAELRKTEAPQLIEGAAAGSYQL